jgi:hypothetical protein
VTAALGLLVGAAGDDYGVTARSRCELLDASAYLTPARQ